MTCPGDEERKEGGPEPSGPLCPSAVLTFRSGFVALLGRPNVGKSSLVNRMLDDKLCIVSPVPQTTRHAIRCIRTTDQSQMVFVDTPGLHEPRTALGTYMVNRVRKALDEVDCLCLVLDARRPQGGDEEKMLHAVLAGATTPLVVAVNKIDGISLEEEAFDGLVAPWKGVNFVDALPVSARTGENVGRLISVLEAQLPVGEPWFPEDMVTDRSERFLAAEIVREKIFELARDEIPHSVTVAVEEFKSPDEYHERETGYIRATVYVEREGQKGILIGEGGRFLKRIGMAARGELEARLGYPVYLELWIKVRSGWRRSPRDLKHFGYDET